MKTRVPNFIKQIPKGHVDLDTYWKWYFNTPLSYLDKSSKLKINKETSELKYTIDQLDLSNMDKYSQQIGNIHFLSITWNLLHNWSYHRYKSSINKYKRNGDKFLCPDRLKWNKSRKWQEKLQKALETKQYIFEQTVVHPKKIIEKNLKILSDNKNEKTIYKNFWDKAVLRGKFIAISAPFINLRNPG